jgi:hypothetical protein
VGVTRHVIRPLSASSPRPVATAHRPRYHVAVGGIAIVALSVSIDAIASTSLRSHART